jgi:hypothetical protein
VEVKSHIVVFWTARGSNPGGEKRFLFRGKRVLFTKTSRPTLGPPRLQFDRWRGSFPDVDWPRREVNHLRQSGAKVENEWSYTFASPIFLAGMDRGNFS